MAIAELTRERLAEMLQAALLRLQLYVVGKTHEVFGEVATFARGVLIGATDGGDGVVDALVVAQVQGQIEQAFNMAYADWIDLLTAARKEAVALQFGRLALEHTLVFGSAASRLTEAQVGVGGVAFFRPQLSAIEAAANERFYGDGMQTPWKLSERVWNLNEESLNGIRQVLMNGVMKGDSAYNMAKELEQYLGAGQECPRWTSTRLYARTKQEIADGDKTGLYTGEACASQGVSYKALRLARTEIQYIHHLAGDTIAKKLPWVDQEKINLSPDHPDIGCACEDAVIGGEKGDGVYPVGMVSLPLHPHCLCYKTHPSSMSDDEFVDRLRGWTDGSEGWPRMDDYASWVGMTPLATEPTGGSIAGQFASGFLAGLEFALQTWLSGDEDDLDGRIAEAG